MSNWLQKQWLSFTFWHFLLLPLSWVFAGIVSVRRLFYKKGWLKSSQLNVPVVVVGNINIGGAGKTPLVIWMAEKLQLSGYKPGIISRGYGGNVIKVTEVSASSDPSAVGDEPVLIAMRTRCPVFVSPNRVDAGQALLHTHPECDVIISDDGLQHYQLQRDVEIVVYDSVTKFGNEALLPAGPLREFKSRLKTVDALVSNGKVTSDAVCYVPKPVEMQLESSMFYNLEAHHVTARAEAFVQKRILAIAGIGNPSRFFQKLSGMGLRFQSKAYADHYAFQAKDFDGIEAEVVLMTEKDAVKCRSFAQPNMWVLPVNAVIDDDLIVTVLNKLKKSRK